MRLLIIAGALLLMGAAPVTPPTPGAGRPEVRAEEELSAHREEVRAVNQMVGLTRWQIVLGWLTAVGLAGSLIMTQRALRQTRESLDLSHLVAREQLRAYIVIDKFEGIEETGWGKRLVWRFRNTGITPATHVESKAGLLVVDDRDIVDLPSNFPEFSRGVTLDLPPEGSRATFLYLENSPLSDDALDPDGTHGVVVVVKVAYRDCFGRRHEVSTYQVRYGKDLANNHLLSVPGP